MLVTFVGTDGEEEGMSAHECGFASGMLRELCSEQLFFLPKKEMKSCGEHKEEYS